MGIELAIHYASADLFIFPSLTETFGNVVPEAMASGLTVVAYNDAAAHHFIRSWDNGITVDPGDHRAFTAAALTAAQDPGLLRRFGSRARRTAETLGWDSVIDTVEKCVFEVINRRRPEPEQPGLAATHD